MATKVIVVGGGFGGIEAAKSLVRQPDIDLTLIDRRNYHLFQPLLYQVATAGLSPAEIAVPIRSLLSGYRNARVILGNVDRVDIPAKQVWVGTDCYSFDFLILACGAKHSYFGQHHWEEHAPGLKTLEQATEIRRRILLAFEMAEKEADPEKRKPWLTFVIVGGGPTGVELAGAIAEISRHTLSKDFRTIDPSRTRVILIERGERIMAAFTPELSRKAARDLENLGVQVWTSTSVTDVTPNGVSLNGEVVQSKTVIWAAGVQPSSLGRSLQVELDGAGRVVVGKGLNIASAPFVYVIGDMAHVQDTTGKPLPGLAPVAMQQGRHVARQIIRTLKQQPGLEFEYKDKGQMATIGRRKAIMQYRNIQMGGLFAWMAWLFIHIYYLLGFKNKFFVFIQWAWSYVSFKKGARLIVDKEWRSIPKPLDTKENSAPAPVDAR